VLLGLVGVKKQPTIHDVAESSGFSKSTVSNVIRGAGHVSPQTRSRVLEAAARLGYRPNALARNLVQRRTSTLGLVVGDLANPFYSELAKLVEAHASEAGYTTMICNTDGRAESERARVESLLEHRVAGILMLQFSGDGAIVGELLAQDVPLVVASCWEERSDCVAVDDAEAAREAVEHLVGLGHRRIAYVSSDLVEPATDRARLEGYRRALAAAGEPPPPVVRLEQPAYLRSDTDLRAALGRALDGADAPTAFFCSNDLVAVDLLETLEEAGLGIPASVSVVGFDDIALAGLARIALTTVAQPTDELAGAGVELLLRRIEGGSDLPLVQRRLDARLVVRASTASPAP
jgi:LacI family transcriptional regulator